MLNPGNKLGTYEITSHIGSGGMGEVYQAHDSKLGRDVAINAAAAEQTGAPSNLILVQNWFEELNRLAP